MVIPDEFEDDRVGFATTEDSHEDEEEPNRLDRPKGESSRLFGNRNHFHCCDHLIVNLSFS